jgi:hypothetical protein
VRVSLSQGEVRLQSGDVHGEPVQLALQAGAFADAGEVVLTDAVYLSMNKSEAPTEILCERPLPGGGAMRLRRALKSGDGRVPYGGRALSRLGRLPDPTQRVQLRRLIDRCVSFAQRRAVWAAAGLLLVAAAAGERGARGREDPLRRAAELLEARQPLAALAALDRLAETPRAHDPRVEVVRGRAEHALGRLGMAFSDFAAAAEQDRRALDAQVIAALADELDAESFPPVWRPALVRLLGERVGRDAAPAVRPLLDSALARTRDDALQVLELAGAASDEDRLRVAAADLADPDASCQSHREAVRRLAVAGGPRAEKLLEETAWKSGCGGAQARDALRRMRRKD